MLFTGSVFKEHVKVSVFREHYMVVSLLQPTVTYLQQTHNGGAAHRFRLGNDAMQSAPGPVCATEDGAAEPHLSTAQLAWALHNCLLRCVLPLCLLLDDGVWRAEVGLRQLPKGAGRNTRRCTRPTSAPRTPASARRHRRRTQRRRQLPKGAGRPTAKGACAPAGILVQSM